MNTSISKSLSTNIDKNSRTSSSMNISKVAVSFALLAVPFAAHAQQPASPDGSTLVSPTMPATATPTTPTMPATATPPTPTMPETAMPPPTSPAGATPLTPPELVTQTDTTPMPVVIEPPRWRLRLGADVSAGPFFPGPAVGGGGAVRIGAQRDRVGLLLELGLLGAAGGLVSENDGDHVASGAAFVLASATPMVQVDVGDHGAFAGLGVILGAGSWSYNEDRVDGDDVIQQGSRSVAFIPGVDARLGWRFGGAHNFTVTAGARVLATSVRTDTVTVSTSTAPTRATAEGIGAAVMPTLSIGYDFK